MATNFKVLVSGTERLRVDSDATTVAGGLTVSGTTNLAQLQCGTLYSAGYLPSNHTFSSGFEMGIVPTVNFARFMRYVAHQFALPNFSGEHVRG